MPGEEGDEMVEHNRVPGERGDEAVEHERVVKFETAPSRLLLHRQ